MGSQTLRSGAITRLFNSALAASCGRALKGGQQEARGVGAAKSLAIFGRETGVAVGCDLTAKNPSRSYHRSGLRWTRR